MPRQHVVISGTGRAGTSFLVELLTHLGLDTGFNIDTIKLDKHARAGLEISLKPEATEKQQKVPYIVKDPWFCDYAEEVLKQKDIHIDHVFIPMRDLYAAAESRRHVQEQAVSDMSLFMRLRTLLLPFYRPISIQGGLWQSHKKHKQEDMLLHQLYKLMLALSNTTVPVTILQYPRLVKDSSYLYEKFEPIMGDITYPDFESIFNNIVRPDWIHSFKKKES